MLNWLEFWPILVVPAVPNGKTIRFLRQDKQLDVDENITEVLWDILAQCNGYRASAEIAELSGIDEETVKKILSELFELKLIVDSRDQYLRFHQLSCNPAMYLRKLTHEQVIAHELSPRKPIKGGVIIDFEYNSDSELFNWQAWRRSCRSFSDEKLTRDQIGNICSYAYSIKKHAVPSGGSLYPLKIYVVISIDQKDIERGYYEYVPEKDFLIHFEKNPDYVQLKYCYNDESGAFNSAVQIIIAADLERQPYKYSNRGYRLTLLEAGHVAQNICLYCAEQKIATCELGGLLDEALMEELSIAEDGVYPLLAVAVGKESDNPLFDYANFLERLEKQLVGENKPIKAYGVSSFKAGDASFFGAWARYGNCESQIAGATAASYYYAACKAIIEGYERYRSGQVCEKYETSVSMHDQSKFISPNRLAPLDPEQRQLYNLQPYDDDTIIKWTRSMEGYGEVYVPTDLVFYGHEKPTLYYGNSSGVAAFSDYKEAKNRALTELIERDALMRNWFEQKSPKRIAHQNLPIHAQRKITHWEKQERTLYVLDMGSPYLPVFQVVIISRSYPHFISGAAAGFSKYDADAILKALQEAEYNLLLAMQYPIAEPPKLEQVKTPADHGYFYHFKKNSDKIKWLWSGEEITEYQETDFDYQLDKLEELLDVIYVDLSEKDSQIKVVRAFSTKLIPISFGYGLDHYLHPEVQKLNFNPKSRKLPHYFA